MSPWHDLQQLLNPWASGVGVHNLSKSTDSIMSLCCQAHGLSPSNVSKEKMKPQLLYRCFGQHAGSRGWWQAPRGQIGWKMPESYVTINGIESTTHTCVGWGLCSDTERCSTYGLGCFLRVATGGFKSRAREQEWGAMWCLETEQNIEKGAVRGASKCAL